MSTVNNTFNFTAMNVQSTESIVTYRKENGFYKAVHLVGVVDGKILDLAEVCFYATKATNYCCVWIHSPIMGLYGRTGAKAGGYGYNREDAAFQHAVSKFDIGCESYATPEKFLKEFASYLGVKVFDIIESHA